MSTLTYWLWLTTRPSLKPGEAARLADRFGGPEKVYFADPAEYELAGLSAPLREELAAKGLDWPERILEDCARLGIRILTIQDAEYPERLRQIDTPPALLYVKGRAIPFDELVTIGVVGSRNATPYGKRIAEELGRDLALRGAVLVSGIAQGLDSTALRSAIEAGGTVCSVLGGGIDRVYPLTSEDLFRIVPQVGALISEYPPGTEPEGWHFPVRNRLISGLSLGVAAVQAGERSGTLITARTALDQNRDVFAFPGPAGKRSCAGTNRLIQRGEAKLIQSAEDILVEYEGLYPGRLTDPEREGTLLSDEPPQAAPPRRGTAASRPLPVRPQRPPEPEKAVDKPEGRAYSTFKDQNEGFTEDEKQILLTLGERTLRPDDLVEETGLTASQVLTALTMLTMRGFLKEEPGNRFLAPLIFREEAPEE